MKTILALVIMQILSIIGAIYCAMNKQVWFAPCLMCLIVLTWIVLRRIYLYFLARDVAKTSKHKLSYVKIHSEFEQTYEYGEKNELS